VLVTYCFIWKYRRRVIYSVYAGKSRGMKCLMYVNNFRRDYKIIIQQQFLS